MAATFALLLRGQNEGDDEPVQTQDLSKNQNEDHADEKPGLLSCAPHAGVADDADSEACCQPTEAHAESGSEVEETPESRVWNYSSEHTERNAIVVLFHF